MAADCRLQVSGSGAGPRSSGFTLLELLVAMAILGILVLIMGQIFHQSSVAWDSGLRKAKGNMSARAALGFMSRELSGAIAYRDNIPNPKLDVDMRANGPAEVTFRKLTVKDGEETRSVEKIRYYQDGDALMRDMQELLPSSGGARTVREMGLRRSGGRDGHANRGHQRRPAAVLSRPTTTVSRTTSCRHGWVSGSRYTGG